MLLKRGNAVLRSILNSRAFIWTLLALPAIPMTMALLNGSPADGGEPVTHKLLHPTGEFAARFMIVAMMITPLRMLFPGARFLSWMMLRRRYFGVAAFAYAAAHTLLYIVDMQTLQAMWAEFFALGIWTGWLAFFVFIPLAATSNDHFVRKLGPAWKSLQRWVYVAALATLVHWIFVHNNLGPALVHFVPLAGLEVYRIWRNQAASAERKPA